MKVLFSVSGKRIVVSRVEVQIQLISVPQCHSVAFEVIHDQSLGASRKVNRSTNLVENPGTFQFANNPILSQGEKNT